MSAYLQKLRRQSKHLLPQSEGKTEEAAGASSSAAPTAVDAAPATAGPSGSTPEDMDEPALDAEDHVFLERLAAIASEPEGEAPPLPTRPVEVTEAQEKKMMGRDAQEALMDGAHAIPLPTSPPEVPAESTEKAKGTDKKKNVMSYFSLDRFKKGDDKKDKDKGAKDKTEKLSAKDKDKAAKDKTEKLSAKDKDKMADDLLSAAQAARAAGLEEQARENKELTHVLDQLNLSAVNNRVFSFSKESEQLLNKFIQVLKDVINGAPHAYDDLEKLFTDYDAQLKKMYGGLPPFMQNMVKSLPAKLTATLGPELLAAGADKPGFDAKAAAGGSKSKKSKIPGLPAIPSLKSLVTAQGAVATALRSIVNFLKLRFPMLATGTNLIMSLAVLVLLFVFWYCHKRGRETRLEKERLAAEEGESARASGASSLNEDADSIFGEKAKQNPNESASGAVLEQPVEPLIIQDSREKEATKAAVSDMPSVSHLPDPKDGKAPGA
ncbi:hypothetical protein ACEQ8H_006349 [Pleosporales sp. CAS-2024a]